jgi:hypothetical protein
MTEQDCIMIFKILILGMGALTLSLFLFIAFVVIRMRMLKNKIMKEHGISESEFRLMEMALRSKRN